jgi:general secretion pathway protein K
MGFKPVRQRGVAVVTALLLTTLAVTIVASLFWQQQVQVRSIENQRLQLQKQWILRGALDWARLILRENARYSPTDTLDQPWAVPLEDTRLDQYVENNRADAEASDATLSGQMVDAQSLYNLTNMCPAGTIMPKEVEVFARLLTSLRLDPELARDTAAMMAATYVRPRVAGTANPDGSSSQVIDALTGLPQGSATGGTISGAGAETGTGAGMGDTGKPRLLAMTQVEDLLAVPGFTVEAVEKLRNLVIFLPRGTALNVNTASPEVLAAVIDKISLSDANVIVATRKNASFRSTSDLATRLPGIPTVTTTPNLGFASNYFLVNGRVRMSRAALQIQALIERGPRGQQAPKTKVIWTREN